MSMETLRQLSAEGKPRENLLKAFLIHLLQALDFLHTDAEMIHAGIIYFASIPLCPARVVLSISARFANEERTLCPFIDQ